MDIFSEVEHFIENDISTFFVRSNDLPVDVQCEAQIIGDKIVRGVRLYMPTGGSIVFPYNLPDVEGYSVAPYKARMEELLKKVGADANITNLLTLYVRLYNPCEPKAQDRLITFTSSKAIRGIIELLKKSIVAGNDYKKLSLCIKKREKAGDFDLSWKHDRGKIATCEPVTDAKEVNLYSQYIFKADPFSCTVSGGKELLSILEEMLATKEAEVK